MIKESLARAQDVAPELLREADACRYVNTNLAGKLEEMAAEVSRIQTCVQQFVTAKTMADLLGAYQTYEFAYSDKFHLILGGFWTDALRSEDQQTIEGLRRGLKLLRDVNVALHEITHAKEQEEGDAWARRLLRNPLACDTHFHEFLDGRARFAGKHHHVSAEGFATLATHLRRFCKTTEALAKAADAPRSVDGYKTVTLPSSAE